VEEKLKEILQEQEEEAAAEEQVVEYV